MITRLPWIPIFIHPIFRRNLKRGDFLVAHKGTRLQYIASNDWSNSLWRSSYTVRTITEESACHPKRMRGGCWGRYSR